MTLLRDAASPEERTERLRQAAALDALERRPLPTDDQALRLDPVYLAARVEFESSVAAIGLAALSRSGPPRELKERLLSRVACEEAPREAICEGTFDVKPGVVAVRTCLLCWTAAPLPGVFHKVLGHDAERRATTRLVRFEPGVRYPDHRHGGTEELFVLEGSVHVNGLVLKAGDYCQSIAGTEEQGSFTDEGALAIIISSDADEIMAR